MTNKRADKEDITRSEILSVIFDEIQSHTRNFKIRELNLVYDKDTWRLYVIGISPYW